MADGEAQKSGMLPVSEALARVLSDVTPVDAETLNLDSAAGRILAEDVTATLTQPPFDASAMDGYAVRAADVATVPCTLRQIGSAAAGHPFAGTVTAGKTVRIFTGGAVPQGADAIVIQEDTKADGDRITILESCEEGNFVRPRGFDFSEGQALIRAGTRLGPRQLTLAATMNAAHVAVRRKPNVAILATGDELVPLGKTPGEGQIISSVPYGIAAMVENAGGEALRLGIARDTDESLAEHLERAADADILLTIGGASVGEHDLVQDALKAAGMTMDFWKIAMRPGKPLMFATRGRQRAIGVPGNPVSALICARIFLVPLIEKMLGQTASRSGAMRVVLGASLPENGPRQHYMRATLEHDDDGRAVATAVRSQDSSLLAPLTEAGCLLVRAPNAPSAARGEEIQALPLDF
jgi:molybdopterin molybdotransferase